MHIVGWHIEGFGIFRDFAIRDLPPRAVIFEGPNETGKSTLLAFLRTVLFGFRTRGRAPVYEPLTGGSHGGRIFLATRQGYLTVERFYKKPARIQLADGTLLSEPEFQQLLGGLDQQTFSSVFAFSLDELSSFESIGSEQISARIFAAGLSGAGPSVRDVITQFEETRDQLLRPRSQQGEINRLVQEISAIEQELRNARQLALSYPGLVEEEELLVAEIEKLGKKKLEIAGALEEARRLCEAWEIQADLLRHRQELNQLLPIDEFPLRARERLADVQGRLHGFEERRAQQMAKISAKEREIEDLELRIDSRLLALAPQITQLAGEVPLYSQRKQDKAKLETERDERRRELGRLLNQLGQGMGAEHVGRIDTSLATKEDLREFRGRFDRLRADLTQAQTRLEADKQRVVSLQEQLTAQKPWEESELAEYKAKAGQVSALLKQARILGQRLVRVRADLESLGSIAAEQERSARATARRRRRVAYVAGAALVAVVVALALVFAVGNLAGPERSYILGIGVFAVFVLAAIFVFGLGSLRWAQGLAGAGGGPVDPAHLRRLEEEDNELSKQLLDIAAAADIAIQTEEAEWPASLLFSLEEALIETEREITRFEEQRKTVEQLQKELQAAVGQEATSREAFERVQQELAKTGEDFRSWLSARGIPPSLSPEGALDFLSLVERAQEALADCVRLDKEIEATEKHLASWEKQAEDLLLQAGLELEIVGSREGNQQKLTDAGESLGRAIMTAKLKVDEVQDLQRELKSAQQKLGELNQDLLQTNESLEKVQEELRQLLAEAGAKDETEFTRRLEIFEKRQKLRERLQDLEAQLTKILGADERAEALRAELEQGRVEAWTQTVQTHERELEEMEERSRALYVRSGQLKEQLRVLENSANVAELENKLLQLKAALAQAIDRWYVAGLAAALLRNTLARYTEERQPRVLAEASGFFAQVTAGRYTRFLALPDKSELVVVEAAGRQKSPGELSRGTAEQLYLCLRMALAHEFSQHAEPLPVVMDDVLVNFDPRRRRAMAKLLLEFAESHQLLLFTCHPEITEVLLELEPSLRVERMDHDHKSGSV